MPYRKKIILLLSVSVFLAVVYILSLVFDPARANVRNEQFTWLPAGLRDEADRIEIFRGGEKIELVLKNGDWYVLSEQLEIPARQGRIDDLFRLLSTRGAFPQRGNTGASHAELGLDGSVRLVIRGGAGLPLLELFVGTEDPSGKSVFLRKSGESQFRSGDRLISTYINGEKNSWLNLKLFDEISVAYVQRVLVYYSGFYGIGEEVSPAPYKDYTICRSGENWEIDSILDKDRTENWIRAVLEATADDILPSPVAEISGMPPAIALIRAELGDGGALELQVYEPMEDGKAFAIVKGKPFVYVLSQWTAVRILRDSGFFESR